MLCGNMTKTGAVNRLEQARKQVLAAEIEAQLTRRGSRRLPSARSSPG